MTNTLRIRASASLMAYGWKNLTNGTICQNVTADTPEKLFEAAGLKVPADPCAPTKHNFQAVPVIRKDFKEKRGRRFVTVTVVEEDVTPRNKRTLFEGM